MLESSGSSVVDDKTGDAIVEAVARLFGARYLGAMTIVADEICLTDCRQTDRMHSLRRRDDLVDRSSSERK
jgi:hypothetical protein